MQRMPKARASKTKKASPKRPAAAKTPAAKTGPFVSGPFKGHYRHDGAAKKHAMKADLVFARGKLTGTGADDVGAFALAGRYDAKKGTLAFQKTYLGAAPVKYKGAFSERDKAFVGTWTLPKTKGTFALAKGRVKAAVVAPPPPVPARVVESLRARPIDDVGGSAAVWVHVPLSDRAFGSAKDLRLVAKIDEAIVQALGDAGAGGAGDSGVGGGSYDLQYRGGSKAKMKKLIQAALASVSAPKATSVT